MKKNKEQDQQKKKQYGKLCKKGEYNTWCETCAAFYVCFDCKPRER